MVSLHNLKPSEQRVARIKSWSVPLLGSPWNDVCDLVEMKSQEMKARVVMIKIPHFTLSLPGLIKITEADIGISVHENLKHVSLIENTGKL
jgi:hypothetical protein